MLIYNDMIEAMKVTKAKFYISKYFLIFIAVAFALLVAVPVFAASDTQPILIVSPNQPVLKPKAVKITKKTPALDLNVEYPQFGIEAIDKNIRDFIGVTIKEFGPGVKSEHWSEALYINYKVSQYKDKTVSVRFYIYSFTGGAHGSETPNFRTYDLKTGKRLYYSDVFKSDYQYLTALWRNAEPQVIAAYKAKGLTMDKYEMDWIREGARPNADNYRNFYLDNRGVVIYFGQYQAAPYAYGTLEVPIKYSKFGDGLSSYLQNL